MSPFSCNNNNGNCNSDDHQQALHHPSPLLVPNYDRLESQDNELIFLQHNVDSILLHDDYPQPLRATTSHDATLSQQTTGVKMVDCPKKNVRSSTDQEIPGRERYNTSGRRRRGDRHSKINTARGPRDRRMRLSVKVASDFFDLQDKLGHDKASETVEWLLIQARTEINKLSAGSAALGSQIGTKSEVVLLEAKPSARCDKKVMRRSSSKSTIFAKESREKARARARERTKEKLLSRRKIEGWKLCHEDEATNNNLNQVGCCQTGQESAMIRSHSSMNNPYLDVLSFDEQQQLGSAGPNNGIMNMADHGYSVEIMGEWSPSFSNHEQNPPRIPQDHQSTDFESWYEMLEAFVQH